MITEVGLYIKFSISEKLNFTTSKQTHSPKYTLFAVEYERRSTGTRLVYL